MARILPRGTARAAAGDTRLNRTLIMPMMLVLTCVVLLSSLPTATAHSSATLALREPPLSQPLQPSALTVNARLPPSIDPNVDTSPPSWKAPPSGWFYGTWEVTYSSNKNYQALHNLQFVSAPVLATCGIETGASSLPSKNASCPTPGSAISPSPAGSPPSPHSCPQGTFPGQNVDLQLYTLGNGSNLVHSAFGYDTPRRANNASAGPGWAAVYDFQGTGALKVSNNWELLAWGEDENGDGYLVVYETADSNGYAPADLDIESRSKTGPSRGTFVAIRKALKALKSPKLTALLDGLVPLTWDGEGAMETGFICGPACRDNCEFYTS